MKYKKGTDKHVRKLIVEENERQTKEIDTKFAMAYLENYLIREDIKEHNDSMRSRDKWAMVVRVMIGVIVLWELGIIQTAMNGDITGSLLKAFKVFLQMFA